MGTKLVVVRVRDENGIWEYSEAISGMETSPGLLEFAKHHADLAAMRSYWDSLDKEITIEELVY